MTRPTTTRVPDATTIRIHMSPLARMEHNRRDPSYTSHEAHIDPDGVHSVWYERDIAEAWEETFGEAIDEYDARQKRASRRIGGADEYYRKIRASRRGSTSRDYEQHESTAPIYEIVASVGSIAPLIDETDNSVVLDEDGAPVRPHLVPDDEATTILADYAAHVVEDLREHIVVTGVYFHADESGVPHVHVDFFGRATGYRRGPAVQCSISKACEQLGHVSTSRRENACSMFCEGEREEMSRIVERVMPGTRIVRPDQGKGKKTIKHDEYRREHLSQEIQALEATRRQLQSQIQTAMARIAELDQEERDAEDRRDERARRRRLPSMSSRRRAGAGETERAL